MAHHHARRQNMAHQDILAWGAAAANNTSTAGEEDVTADLDEPPDHRPTPQLNPPNFYRASIRSPTNRKESLLTKALAETTKPEMDVVTDLNRRRSTLSSTSTASTVDLTSDGGITSPARTNTPSPPFPTSSYMSFAPLHLGQKPLQHTGPTMIKQDTTESMLSQLPVTATLPKPDATVEALVKKRCITFACGGQKPSAAAPAVSKTTSTPSEAQTEKPTPKRCTIKFACPGPKASSKNPPAKEVLAIEPTKLTVPKSPETYRRRGSRSPSLTRKPRQTPPAYTKPHRDPIVRRAGPSPVATRSRKPKYIIADEDSLLLSEATRFHEFASDEVQEDDWIRKDVSETKVKMTINDTLKKENAIRQLGKEAEEEALQDEEEEEEDNGEAAEDSDDENEEEDDDEDEDDNGDSDDQEDDDNTVDGSDDGASDGNETDNEAGFADSDDESDAAGDYQFWTPGRSIFGLSTEPAMIRPSGHRAASDSSIDSLKHMSPIARALDGSNTRKKPSRRIRIRPGTPDLPDSTDFVCGTLDEDRPLEDAYVSCMEARKRQKHFLIPQDIDPSFPTSDPEDAEEDEVGGSNNDSDEHVWIHGQFEDSDDESTRRRRRPTRSPGHSPKRLHSPPPPAKHRLRSPPPRRLFGGHSPKRTRSPPLARTIRSPPASPTSHATSGAIAFAPLGQRPGLTHTKSLPRVQNAFCKQYREARLAAIRSAVDGSDTADGHTRGAIDIVKGLEQKRQRRKEKFYQKHCNRARKGQAERKPQPGKGAERMRELGLQMAGKLETRTGKAEFVLSI